MNLYEHLRLSKPRSKCTTGVFFGRALESSHRTYILACCSRSPRTRLGVLQLGSGCCCCRASTEHVLRMCTSIFSQTISSTTYRRFGRVGNLMPFPTPQSERTLHLAWIPISKYASPNPVLYLRTDLTEISEYAPHSGSRITRLQESQ